MGGRKRLGMLVIGDEILAGHVHESNSHWVAKRCKQLGIDVARVEICTDELGDIEQSVRRFLNDLNLDYVITSGGLGPTPDDRTMEGLARALGVPLELRDEDVAWMHQHVAEGHRRGYFASSKPNPGMMKMAYVPVGATSFPNQIGTCLGVKVEHDGTQLFTLPGVPRELERMFDESVVPLLERGEPEHVEELILYTEESRFYDVLCQLEQQHPDVAIGSYPQRGHIVLRATGQEANAKAVIAALREAGSQYLSP